MTRDIKCKYCNDITTAIKIVIGDTIIHVCLRCGKSNVED